MAGWDGAGSIFAVRMRLSRLNADGTIVVGAQSQLVTKALVTANFTPQVDEGDEISQKNGSGETCLYYKAPDTLKSIDFELTLCTPDPQAQEMLSGGTVLTSGSNAVGYAAPAVGSIANPNGVGVEMWSRAIINGAAASSLPYLHWVFPRLSLTQDQATLENQGLNPVFKGTGQENDGWGDGPLHDWDFESSRLWQWARVDASDLPAESNGYAAVAAGS